MSPRYIRSSGAAALAASLTLLLILGCGDGTGLARRYKVSGTVNYKGAPLEKGTITFAPVDPNVAQAATGQIEGGSYSLTTAVDGDGALPGEYKVTISSREVDLTTAAGNVQGGSMRQDDVAKANAEAKKNIPAKYELAETSGLTYTVEKRSNTANFDLTD